MNNNPDEAPKKTEDQDNIGYENTEVRNDQDNRENERVETTDTGHGEGAREDENDTGGLRSESGKKSMGKTSGNNREVDKS
jgi:hypothetical protein